MIKHVTHAELSVYLDGEANRPRRIERHLAGCPECAGHLIALQRLSEGIRRLEAADVHPSFAANVVGRIREQQAEPAGRRIAWWALPGSLVAAALVALVVAFGTLQGGDSVETPVTQPVAQIPVTEDMVAVSDEIETPYAAASDTSWMFAREFRTAPEPPADSDDRMMVSAATAEWFSDSPVITLAMDDGRDFESAITSMGAAERNAFLLLLSDYARGERGAREGDAR